MSRQGPVLRVVPPILRWELLVQWMVGLWTMCRMLMPILEAIKSLRWALTIVSLLIWRRMSAHILHHVRAKRSRLLQTLLILTHRVMEMLIWDRQMLNIEV